MDLVEICCEDGRWIKLAQDCVQWWVLVLAVLNLCVLPPDGRYVLAIGCIAGWRVLCVELTVCLHLISGPHTHTHTHTHTYIHTRGGRGLDARHYVA